MWVSDFSALSLEIRNDVKFEALSIYFGNGYLRREAFLLIFVELEGCGVRTSWEATPDCSCQCKTLDAAFWRSRRVGY